MNGRIDLIQAESVLSMVTAQSQQAASQAFRQLEGQLSEELEGFEYEIIWCLAQLEAEIDFLSENIEVVSRQKIQDKLSVVLRSLNDYVDSYKRGKLIKEGFRVVLVGEPNVGKSSLFNALLSEDRAIVTNIPGTTRDLIESQFNYKGFRFILFDTAGLLISTDVIENKGIEKSLKAVVEEDALLVLCDVSEGFSPSVFESMRAVDRSKMLFVGSKMDTVKDVEKAEGIAKEQLRVFFPSGNIEEQFVSVSALQKESAEALMERLWKRVNEGKFRDRALISQARHFENLSMARDNLMRTLEALKLSLSNEFIVIELKEALLRIQETIGKRFDDQIVDRIFKDFCVGK